MANGQKGPWIQRGASIAAVFFAAAAAFAPGLRAADPGWPREIRGDAATIILYEPQVESMKGDLLKARSAFSLTPEGKTDPVFGVLFATARMRTDRDARTATLVSATIDRVRFPEITEGQEKELKALVEAEVGQWELVVSLDSLTALLAAAEREQKTSEQLASEPPKILVEKQLAVLVLIDGEPKLETIDGTSLQRVVNTPFAILFDPRAKAFFLSNGETWYEAPAATGPYSVVAKPPADVARIAEAAKKDQQAEEKEQGITGKPKPARPPKVVVSTEPAELLSFDGEPSYVPVTGLADLLYVSNTESNVLKDLQSQLTFVLLSGRWFSSRSLQGPWTFVGADKLPASFAKVPEGSPIGDVLPFVAGTQLAEDAVLDAEIPQTTAINRAEAKLDVSYDGEPEFEAVEGTSLRHAKNASTQVLSSGANYYACDQGVWYVAGSPNGPWEVSTERPPDVDRIPPASPAYGEVRLHLRRDSHGRLRRLHAGVLRDLRLGADDRLRHRLPLPALVPPHLLRLAGNVGLSRPLESLVRLVVRLRLHGGLLQLRVGLARALERGPAPLRARRLVWPVRVASTLLGSRVPARARAQQHPHQREQPSRVPPRRQARQRLASAPSLQQPLQPPAEQDAERSGQTRPHAGNTGRPAAGHAAGPPAGRDGDQRRPPVHADARRAAAAAGGEGEAERRLRRPRRKRLSPGQGRLEDAREGGLEQACERFQLGCGGPQARALARPGPRLFGAAAEQPEDPGLPPLLRGSAAGSSVGPAFGPVDRSGAFERRTRGNGGQTPRLTSGRTPGEEVRARPRGRPKAPPGSRRAGSSPPERVAKQRRTEEAHPRWPRPRERTGAPSGCPTPW
jgi:hypothetical protein